jgi:hypothetical protein
LKDVYSVMAAWGAYHGTICYGHVGTEYWPSYWSAFGMYGEGTDYRASATLGPMYGKKYKYIDDLLPGDGFAAGQQSIGEMRLLLYLPGDVIADPFSPSIS